MKEISTIGLDIAKNVFQVHGVDKEGRVVEQKKLRRKDMLGYFLKLRRCVVGIEACATAHYWGRELGKLGHDVKLIPPSYVKPYVRRGKNDAVDAAAICEAVSRPHMRFVPIKSEDQQAALMLHKTRDLLIKQRTQQINALRAHLAELGYVFAEGNAGATQAQKAAQDDSTAMPACAKQALRVLAAQIETTHKAIADVEKSIRAWHQGNEASQLLATVPGIGVIAASSLAATIGDASQFKSGRELAAWIGLTPRQNSSGGKERLGSISKQGNASLRRLLVMGAVSQLRGDRRKKAPGGGWFPSLLTRKPPLVAVVALANKMARVAWAVMSRREAYRSQSSAVSGAAA